jgi:nucleoside-diphosphate kinase
MMMCCDFKGWRQLLGPTKVFKAIHSHPDSIRGLFGLTDTRNACHGSDSVESVAKEIKIFFPDFKFT